MLGAPATKREPACLLGSASGARLPRGPNSSSKRLPGRTVAGSLGRTRAFFSPGDPFLLSSPGPEGGPDAGRIAAEFRPEGVGEKATRSQAPRGLKFFLGLERLCGALGAECGLDLGVGAKSSKVEAEACKNAKNSKKSRARSGFVRILGRKPVPGRNFVWQEAAIAKGRRILVEKLSAGRFWREKRQDSAAWRRKAGGAPNFGDFRAQDGSLGTTLRIFVAPRPVLAEFWPKIGLRQGFSAKFCIKLLQVEGPILGV